MSELQLYHQDVKGPMLLPPKIFVWDWTLDIMDSFQVPLLVIWLSCPFALFLDALRQFFCICVAILWTSIPFVTSVSGTFLSLTSENLNGLCATSSTSLTRLAHNFLYTFKDLFTDFSAMHANGPFFSPKTVHTLQC